MPIQEDDISILGWQASPFVAKGPTGQRMDWPVAVTLLLRAMSLKHHPLREPLRLTRSHVAVLFFSLVGSLRKAGRRLSFLPLAPLKGMLGTVMLTQDY